MRKALLIATLAAAGMIGGFAQAAEIEVHMLNKGEKGGMVFEPDFIQAAPGDTVKFLPTDKGHNAESIKGMLPDGVDKFKSKINQEFVLTVEKDGLYGVKCTPHYGLGMVALIAVGEPVNEDAARAVKQTGKAKARFADIFAAYDASK
ncbi:MAG TPA: pseudoazurin [Afifellaceae bacterium]|nr:pseudoazurin [Afifellaceae bacterium]